MTLWWEIRPSIRKISSSSCGKINIPREEVGGEIIARAGQRMVEEEDDTRLETLQQLAEGTWGQASGSRRHMDLNRSKIGLVA